FNEEALEESVSDPGAAARLAEDLVANRGRSMSLWEDGEVPVSMAATGGSTPNGGRVYAVYTPPEHRRKGYASALVAVLSRRLLDRGPRYCFLCTDRPNPTSNHTHRPTAYELVPPVDPRRFGRLPLSGAARIPLPSPTRRGAASPPGPPGGDGGRRVGRNGSGDGPPDPPYGTSPPGGDLPVGGGTSGGEPWRQGHLQVPGH